MTDVPPNGDGTAPQPRPTPPDFDDDALAAALEADIKSYTAPITVIPPAASTTPPVQPPPVPPAPPAPPVPPAPPAPPPAPPAPPAPSYETPSYQSDYEPPDVPEYTIPPAPPTPDYEVPPAPVFDVPVEPQAAASGPTTLDAIQRLEDELRRQGLGDATGATPVQPGPASSAAPPWEPALDHPAPGHVFPSPYQPFTDGITIPRQDLPQMPPDAPAETPAAQPAQPGMGDWSSAPPPAADTPPPLVEPQAPQAPRAVPPSPPPADPAADPGYSAPTVLPPLREVRLEDVQGLPPPIGQQAAPLPPYDPGSAAPPAFGAPPVAPPPSAPPFAAAPLADPFGAPPAPLSPDSFSGPYATPVDTTMPQATEPASLDENDDAVDDIDKIFGAPPGPAAAAAAGPFPSQPIATASVTETQPGLVDQKPENHPVFVVEHAGADPSPLDLRAGRAARMFWLWFATNSSVVSIAIGAVLFSLGMSLRQAIVATLAGVALSFLPLGLGTLAGKWSGQPTMIVSRASFGHVGNILPAIVAVLTRVFWGAVLLWILAISIARLLVFAGLDAGLGETVWTFVILGIGFVVGTVIAVFGYGFVARMQLVFSILSGLLVAGLIYLTFPRLDLDAALSVPDGSWLLVLGGAIIVFSFVGLAWVQSSSDIARYQRPSSSGAQSMLWATIGATLPPFALIAWGAMLAASDPVLATGLASSPLPTIARMLPLWYPTPLIAAAGLGLLSSVVLAMYSGGFALQAVGLKTRRSISTLLAAILVAAVAAGLVILSADALSIARDLATTLAVPVAAWAGIFAAEMMIRTRTFDSPSLVEPGGVYPQIRTVNFVAFLLLTAIGYGLTTATFPGLTWQGYLLPLVGIPADSPLGTADIGVIAALVLGIIVPLATAIPTIRRQELQTLKLEHTGPIPRVTGSVPRQTGSVPRATGPVPAAAPPGFGEPPPRLEP
ncbi:MAG: cytosine permease [Microbacteriaceae bacterium]